MLLAIVPTIVINFSNLIHIAEPTNALFLIYIFLIIIIIFYISIAFSKLFEKVTKLIQENAILRYKIENLEEELKKENKNENN